MKASITVKDRTEKAAIECALADPETRAFVVIVGTLLPFSNRARARILSFVADSADERQQPLALTISSEREVVNG